ncbi:MAG: FixH family protein [Neisseria sp.]|nr:FixH family protein [Neisseria sp.]
MTDSKKTGLDNHPWYKEPWPWILISLPLLMVFISIFGLILPSMDTEDTLVTDDYYKEGKNIILQIERDEKAFAQHISAQVYIQPNMDGVMVITQGEYDTAQPLRLLFMHPTLKKYDQTVELKQSENNPFQYTAQLEQALPDTNNWVVRLEDTQNQWRIERRWIVSQGNAVTLIPQHMGTPPKDGKKS